jgi:flagellar protein FlaG
MNIANPAVLPDPLSSYRPRSGLVASNHEQIKPVENAISLTAKAGQESSVSGNAVPPGSETKMVNQEDLQKAISDLNKYVQNVQRDLQFTVDDASGRTVIKVIDSESKETIRQIPAEEMLQIARSIKEAAEGSLLMVKV